MTDPKPPPLPANVMSRSMQRRLAVQAPEKLAEAVAKHEGQPHTWAWALEELDAGNAVRRPQWRFHLRVDAYGVIGTECAMAPGWGLKVGDYRAIDWELADD